MIVLLQRVSQANCTVNGQSIAAIGVGIVALVCAERNDTLENAKQLANKVLKYRVFSDSEGKMNLSLLDIRGEVLLVPQFTLAADTKSGTRPSFTPAANPELGVALFEQFVAEIKCSGLKVETGVFGAHMQVSLTNDGPVTFWLQVPHKKE